MSFDVYPAQAREPLTVPHGSAVGEPISRARVGFGVGGVPTMVVRIAVWADDGAAPPDVVPVVEVVADGTAVPVTSRDGVDPTPVAAGRAHASVYAAGRAGRGVCRVEIYGAPSPPVAWELRVASPSPSPLRVVWVVADGLAEAKQPWMHVIPETVDLASPPPAEQAFTVLNRGTGPLRLLDAPGSTPATDVTVASVTEEIPTNGSGRLLLGFAGPRPANGRLVHDLGSDDTTARPTPPGTHNRRVTVTFTPWGLITDAVPPIVLHPAERADVVFTASGPPGGVVVLSVSEPGWATVGEGAQTLGGPPVRFTVSLMPPPDAPNGLTGTVTAILSDATTGVPVASVAVAYRVDRVPVSGG